MTVYITVVRRGSVQSNLFELTQNCPSRKLPPSSQGFETVRCGRTAPNTLKPSLWACFPLCHSDSRMFGVFEPPQTHSNLSCRPASPYITVVRGGSVYSNLPKLTQTFPVGPLHPPSQWFEEVRRGRTAPNSLQPYCRPASPLSQ